MRLVFIYEREKNNNIKLCFAQKYSNRHHDFIGPLRWSNITLVELMIIEHTKDNIVLVVVGYVAYSSMAYTFNISSAN